MFFFIFFYKRPLCHVLLKACWISNTKAAKMLVALSLHNIYVTDISENLQYKAVTKATTNVEQPNINSMVE